MQQDVLICVNARLDFFEKYYQVPAALQPEVDDFITKLKALGESSADAGAFEAAFASSGLSAQFNGLLPRLTPVAQAMTPEQKQYSKQVRREVLGQTAGKVVEDMVSDVADTIMVEAEEELIARRRKDMINAGVYDEYTKVTNAVEDAGIVGGFLKGLFGKKKNGR